MSMRSEIVELVVLACQSLILLPFRGEKKVICNKIPVQSAVTCLVWPPQQASFVFGLADGKVKLGAPKGSKSQTLYNTGACTVSIAVK